MSHATKKYSVVSPTSTLSAPSVGNDANGVNGRTSLELPVEVRSDVVAQWIQQHYTPYDGDEGFLAPPTERTQLLNDVVQSLMKQELEKGILDVDVSTPSGINAHEAGYIDPELEVVVGLQTDAPLKRSIKPFGKHGLCDWHRSGLESCRHLGGYRLVEKALESYGYTPDAKLHEIFQKFRKTHNDGVFDAYTKEMRAARKSHILTGLPDG